MKATAQQESEATQFAMELLMPVEFMKRECAKLGHHDICDDKWVKLLANKFKVPMTIMAIRIGQLKERGDL